MVVKLGGDKPWKVVDTQNGGFVGSSDTEEKAKASVRAIYANEEKKRKK